MAYHVNEDKPANKATVHKDGCDDVQVRTKLPKNGKWYEYINLRDEAMEVARNTGRRVKKCANCKP